MAQLPVSVREHLVLSALGEVRAGAVEHLTLQSDGLVCVTQETRGERRALVFDMDDPIEPLGGWVDVDFGMAHLASGIGAVVKGKRGLTLWNIKDNRGLAKIVFDTEIDLIRWVTPTTIGIITRTAVYHLSTSSTAKLAATKVFSREPALRDATIVDYVTSNDKNFCALVGLCTSPGSDLPLGVTQIYNCNLRLSDIIFAHAVAFAHVDLDAYPRGVTVLVYAKSSIPGAKLSIVPITSSVEKGFKERHVEVDLPMRESRGFICGVHINSGDGVIFMLESSGLLHLCDIESGRRICSKRISEDPLIASAADVDRTGVLAIDARGRLFSVQYDESAAVPYVLEHVKNNGLNFACRLAGREKTSAGYVSTFLAIARKFPRIEVAEYLHDAWCGEMATNASLRAVGRVGARMKNESGTFGISAADVLCLRAAVLFFEGMFEYAFQHTAQALKLDPDHRAARIMHWKIDDVQKAKAAGTQAFLDGDYALAIGRYDAALKEVGENPEEASGGRIRSILLANRAVALLRLGEYSEAIRDASQALELAPMSYKSLRTRGRAYFAQNKHQLAITDFKAALKALLANGGQPSDEVQIKSELEDAQARLQDETIRQLHARRRKNYYHLLGVERDASAADVAQAYRHKTLLFHPSKGGNAQTFALITEAYEVLSDPRRRRKHDAELR